MLKDPILIESDYSVHSKYEGGPFLDQTLLALQDLDSLHFKGMNRKIASRRWVLGLEPLSEEMRAAHVDAHSKYNHLKNFPLQHVCEIIVWPTLHANVQMIEMSAHWWREDVELSASTYRQKHSVRSSRFPASLDGRPLSAGPVFTSFCEIQFEKCREYLFGDPNRLPKTGPTLVSPR